MSADLYMELKRKVDRLDRAIESLARNGVAKAQTERDYRVALAQMMLQEIAAGCKVTVLGDLCRGDPHIADLKLKRDIAESTYETNIEAINAWKLQIRIIEAQIGREWGRRDE